MLEHILNPHSDYVWEDIWKSDVYASPSERRRRAQKRINDFGLAPSGVDGPLLDVGCGSGDFLKVLSEMNSKKAYLVGMDRSANSLNSARYHNDCPEIFYVRSEATEIPFRSETFRFVTLFGIVEHIRNHQKLFAELYRVMQVGALAYITSSNAASFLQIKNRTMSVAGFYRYGYQKNWSIRGLRSELERWFDVQRMFVVHADKDMPVIASLDKFSARIIPNWGRYCCFVVSK